jgi:hypothetical protein
MGDNLSEKRTSAKKIEKLDSRALGPSISLAEG